VLTPLAASGAEVQRAFNARLKEQDLATGGLQDADEGWRVALRYAPLDEMGSAPLEQRAPH